MTTVRSLKNNRYNLLKTRGLTFLFKENNVYLYIIVRYIFSLNLLND